MTLLMILLLKMLDDLDCFNDYSILIYFFLYVYRCWINVLFQELEWWKWTTCVHLNLGLLYSAMTFKITGPVLHLNLGLLTRCHQCWLDGGEAPVGVYRLDEGHGPSDMRASHWGPGHDAECRGLVPGCTVVGLYLRDYRCQNGHTGCHDVWLKTV